MMISYRNLSKKSGIYKITNIVTGKIYIGSCVNFAQRATKHFNALKRNQHPNQHLQNAYNLNGESSFIFSIIRECDREVLVKNEQEEISSSDANMLYNIRKLASSNLGLKMNEETKRKMSESGKNKIFSEEHKKNLSIAKKGFAPMKGRKFTKEHSDKIKKASQKPVYCPELDKIFSSLVEAALFLEVSSSSIGQSIRIGTRVKYKYTFFYEAKNGH